MLLKSYIESGDRMDDFDSFCYVIIVFIVVILLSRVISFVLGTYFLESRFECEFWAFFISFLIDSILMYVMLKYEQDWDSDEAINFVLVKAFPFILFYVLGLVMFEWCVNQIVNFRLPPLW